jgi:conjugative relaxase-like TrwC/TraI family protein
MIRFHTSRSASDAVRYYAHLSQGDYYAQDGRSVGRWGGKLADTLGLSGEVLAEAWAEIAHNRDPRTGEQLTPRLKENRRVGVDVTMDVCKSASILWALGGDERIPELVQRASQEVLSEWMEPDMRVRLRARGQNGEAVTGAALWSTWLHVESRPSKADGLPDCQIHTHNFIANVTERDGRLFAAETGEMHRKARLYEAVFAAKIAEGLQQLGYRVERRGDGYEIAGISRKLIEKFSRRTQEIEEEARKRGITDAKEKDALGARTRLPKREELTRAELRGYWESRLTDDERNAIAAVRGQALERSRAGETPAPALTARQAVEWAMRHHFEKDAVVEDWKIAETALRHGVGSVTAAGVGEALEEKIEQGQLVGRKKDGKRLLTTPEAWRREQGIVGFAKDGRGTCKPLAPKRTIQRDWLNREQKRAVRRLWDSGDRVMLVRGAPGVGKTTLLQEAVEGIEAGGRKVFAFAPSAEASRGTLRESGFADAETVALLLKDERLQQRIRGQVLLVDEAGLMGARDAAAFFDLARRAEARVIVVGDRRQHGAVEQPGTLKLLETQAFLPVAEVGTIQRQRGKYQEVVERLSRGDTEGGLDRLEALGWVREIADPKEREQQLAAEYLEAVARRQKDGAPATALVISPSHAEGDRIAETIRQELKQRQKIGSEERELLRLDRLDLSEAERADADRYVEGEVVQFYQNAPGFQRGQRVTVVGHDELGSVCVANADGQVKALRLDQAAKFQVFRRISLKLAAGDRIRITGNGSSKDSKHRLNNGDLLTVAGFTPAGDIVDQRGWVVPATYGHLSQGYVITSQASQSKTVDHVILGMSARSFRAMSREGLLVSVSRGRSRATIYTDDVEGLRDAVRRSEERLTATELLKEQAGRRARATAAAQHWQRWQALHGQERPKQATGLARTPHVAAPAAAPAAVLALRPAPGEDRSPPERTR